MCICCKKLFPHRQPKAEKEYVIQLYYHFGLITRPTMNVFYMIYYIWRHKKSALDVRIPSSKEELSTVILSKSYSYSHYMVSITTEGDNVISLYF